MYAVDCVAGLLIEQPGKIDHGHSHQAAENGIAKEDR